MLCFVSKLTAILQKIIIFAKKNRKIEELKN